MSPVEVVAAVLLLVGVGFNLLGGVGLLRFPDVLSRMHAATKPVTLGLACILSGSALIKLAEGDVPSATKLVVAAGLQFITAPVGAHMVGRAAYRAGSDPLQRTGVDELADVPATDVDEPYEAGSPGG